MSTLLSILSVFKYAIFFFVGMALGGSVVYSNLQDYKLEAAVLRADQGRRDYEKLVAAQDALDAARRDAVDLRDMAVRVRNAYEDRLRRAEAVASSPCQADCAECERLLKRGADLLARGGTLLQDAAAKHDALVGAR